MNQAGELHMLVIYDVENNRKRNRLARYLLGYGERVQESAFEAFVSHGQYKRILRDMQGMIDVEQDSIRVYKLSDRMGTSLIGRNIVVTHEGCAVC